MIKEVNPYQTFVAIINSPFCVRCSVVNSGNAKEDDSMYME